MGAMMIVVFLIFIFLLVNIVIWYSLSRCNYDTSEKLKSGDKYTSDGREYKLPEIELVGDAYKLNDNFVAKQREMLTKVVSFLEEQQIQHWISGGTLLGFIRHETFIPWDDDCDVHTLWENREYMHSVNFANAAKAQGLEVIHFMGGSLNYATRESAAVRIRVIGTTTPVCDVFFVKEKETDVFAKVDGWSNKGQTISYNSKEVWSKDLLFPIAKQTIDDLDLFLPNQPLDVLKQQYGENVMTKMYARSLWFSHEYPFTMFPFIWVTKHTSAPVPQVSVSPVPTI